MKNLIQYILFGLSFMNLNGYEEERSALDQFIGPWRMIRKMIFDAVLRQNRGGKTRQVLELNHRVQKIAPDQVLFPCDTKKYRSTEKPNSVHRLRPGDIDVIGAIGDSLTAGTGLTATNILDLYLEERGQSLTIGGDATWRKYLTLPNILKEFNPNLIGYSTGAALTIEENSNLNVAEVGAISGNMPYMAKVLIKRIKSNKKINLQEDWKMVTVFIGCNNFCSEVCYNGNLELQLKKHKQDMIEVLRLFRDNLPRTIVNVIPPPHLRLLKNLKGKPAKCDFLHLFLCPCLFGYQFAKTVPATFSLIEKWQQIDLDLQKSKEFDREDFAVVVQPFFINYTFPTVENGNSDFSLLSEDCFHFSQKGDARVANDLWNNLMEPVGKKSTDGNNLFEKFLCPTEQNPYIYTLRNSNP